MNINDFINFQTAWWLELIVAVLLVILITQLAKAVRWLKRIERNLRKDGMQYPDDEQDETAFRREGIPIPGEGIKK